MNKDLAAVFSAIFPPNRIPEENVLQSIIQEQYKVDKSIKKNRKKKPHKKVDTDTESDEELKAQLRNAVTKYKKNKKKEEPPDPGTRPPKCETILPENSNSAAERFKAEKSSINVRSGNGDASTDIMELINYFFGAQKDGNTNGLVKSYSEYEKLGAIPKRLGKDRGKNPLPEGKAENAEVPKSKRDKQMDETKVSEETCSRPFFYIVPENPSPEFFLPRGSYYVVPRAPGSLVEDEVVFHPESSAPPAKKKNSRKIKPNVELDSSEMNNLSKDAFQKMDSHLNIGPLDVKISDSSNNLESSYSSYKDYDKVCMNPDESALCDADRELFREILDNIERLRSEFPDMSEKALVSLAEKYVYDEPGLDTFIDSEHLERRIQAQFERLALALPESDPVVLMGKCNEFRGDERFEQVYIIEVLRENKIVQHVTDLQNIFPDADPDFLRENVEKLNCDEEAINMLTDELLESRDYPRISHDEKSMERARLWNKYFGNFNVKEYVREVPNPNLYAGPLGNGTHDTDLVYKYLRARYPNKSLDSLQSCYTSFRENLTNTCESLNSTEVIGPWRKSIQKADYTEDFLKEICYIEHRREICEYWKEIEVMKVERELQVQDALENDCFLTCPLCSDDRLVPCNVVTCPEGHVFCSECITQYINIKMSEGVYRYVCPSEKCDEFFTLKILEDLLSEKVIRNIVRKQQAEEISTAEIEGLETCPHCEFAYIPSPEDRVFKCQNSACLMETCRKCGEKSHIPLRCEEIERPADLEARKRVEEAMTMKLLRVCPGCSKKIVRLDGCNKIACSCGTLFCYICGDRINGYDHFDKPGGCPLHKSNAELHGAPVVEAGIRARDEILRENPNIRLLHDPTVTPQNPL